MGGSRASGKTDESLLRFCALEYRPQAWGRTAPLPAPVILLVLKDERKGLRFLVPPELRSIVRTEDLAYLDPLLIDLRDRARQHPAALFKQLSSLGSGPLVAQEVGEELTDHPSLQDLFSKFVEI